MHSFRPATHQYLIDMDQVMSVNRPGGRTLNLTPYMPFCISQTPHSFARPTWTFSTPCNLRITPTCAATLQHQQQQQPQQAPFHSTPFNVQQQQQATASFHSCITSCPLCFSDHRIHPLYLQYARSLLRRIADEQSEIERLQHRRQHSLQQQQQQQQWQQQLQQRHPTQQQQHTTPQAPMQQHTAWPGNAAVPQSNVPSVYHYFNNPPSFHLVQDESHNIPNDNNNIESNNNTNNNNNSQRSTFNAANFTDQQTQHNLSSQLHHPTPQVQQQHSTSQQQQQHSNTQQQQQMHRFVSMHIVHILQYQHRLQLIRQQLEQQQQQQHEQQQQQQRTHQNPINQPPPHNIQQPQQPQLSHHHVHTQRSVQQQQQQSTHMHFTQPQQHYSHHYRQQQHLQRQQQQQLPQSPFVHDTLHYRHHPHLFQTLIPDYLQTRVARQTPVLTSTHSSPSPLSLQFVLARVGRTPLTQYRMINLYEESTDLENYETLLHITEQMGEVRIRGLSVNEINSLPSYRYKPDDRCHGDGDDDGDDDGDGKKAGMDEKEGVDDGKMEDVEMKEEEEEKKEEEEVEKDAGEKGRKGEEAVLGSVQVSCVVCLCDFEVEQWLKVMPCLHEFHADCISKWLKENNTCPLCRSDIAEKLRKSASLE